jgi:hypothetical protein
MLRTPFPFLWSTQCGSYCTRFNSFRLRNRLHDGDLFYGMSLTVLCFGWLHLQGISYNIREHVNIRQGSFAVYINLLYIIEHKQDNMYMISHHLWPSREDHI